MNYDLKPGERLVRITEVFGDLAFGQASKGDGTILMDADGECVATVAIHRRHLNGIVPTVGSCYAVCLGRAREGSTFQYFGNQPRLLSAADAVSEPLTLNDEPF